jgi:CheY-like chemotaxis protein
VVKSVKVFVVDDHEAFRRAVTAIVDEVAGFVVVGSAESGEESLELLSGRPADLVLMDVHLPGMTGIEAAQVLTTAPDPPVVVLLSTYDEGEVDHLESGAVAYVNKAAFSPSRLVEVWASATG